METIEQTLDKWLNEFADNKSLYKRLNAARKTIETPNITQAINLTKRDIDALLEGLNYVIQSNKESIMDCSYNVIQEKKKK